MAIFPMFGQAGALERWVDEHSRVLNLGGISKGSTRRREISALKAGV
jgi:hypothetical protein